MFKDWGGVGACDGGGKHRTMLENSSLDGGDLMLEFGDVLMEADGLSLVGGQ